jgi:hypothetical protein
MKAHFISLAVGYALAGGALRRKGQRQRPWLEIRRLETESIYLCSQARALRRGATAEARCIEDLVPGQGFYDICRLRFQHPWLERVMEICCPDGRQCITAAALQIAGPRGLAQLWLDAGSWSGRTGLLQLASLAEAEAVQAVLQDAKIPCSSPSRQQPRLELAPGPAAGLMTLLRPHVHRSMRHVLHPDSCHGNQRLRFFSNQNSRLHPEGAGLAWRH